MPAAERPPATATVVYIEDRPATAQLIERIVALRPGVRLVSADRGQTGLALIAAERPNLVLLDLNLPDMPGEDVIVRLAGDDDLRGIPVVVVSADATPQRIERARALGVARYLVKPVVVADVLELLDAHLAHLGGAPDRPPSGSGDRPDHRPSVLDPTCVGELRRLDAEAGGIADLVALLDTEGAGRLDEMRAALARADRAALARLAHQLHGSAAPFCAVELAALCRRIEEISQGRNGAADLARLIGEADSALRAAVDELVRQLGP
jgi:CheY-like chemotaxis protein